MTGPLLVILIPALAALILVFVPRFRPAAWINLGASAATLAVALALPRLGTQPGGWFVVDALNLPFVILTAFIGFTAAWFSSGYIGHEIAARKLKLDHIRYYHPLFQAFTATMTTALLVDNLGVMWVAVEGATLATVTLVGIYRTPAGMEAAWKYFILCGVGIALALFGTILLYTAARPAVGSGEVAMTWTRLMEAARGIDPRALDLAFVFLLVGYGTKAGLVPMHAWLPDAHAEGPMPISAVLSGSLLNVALYAILRFKALTVAVGGSVIAGPMMMGLGLLSLLVAALMLYRRRDIKRLFAYSSIEHVGIITFALGVGGPAANLAGLLHMTMHGLIKSGLFLAVGDAVQATGTQRIADMRGLTVSHPTVGWTLLLAVVAIAGLPPFGLFNAEFLLITSTFAERPALIASVSLGVLLALGALVTIVQGICFGPRSVDSRPIHGSRRPAQLHLVLALVAGFYLPGPLVEWLQAAARMLG